MSSGKPVFSFCLCLALTACANTGSQEVVEQVDVVTETDVAQSQGSADPTQSQTTENQPKPEIAAEQAEPPEVKVVETHILKPTKPEVKSQPVTTETKTANGKLILGQEEWLYIPGLDKSFRAQLDTSVTTSAVSAQEITKFYRNGTEWVKFKIAYKQISSNEISLPVLRWTDVNEPDKRKPVVTSWVQIGDVQEVANFALTDSKQMSAPVQLGSKFISSVGSVDFRRQFIQPKRPEPKQN
ncbi:putative ATP-dependent zinc protease [Vibrio sp. SCSIO 43137]|uniref:putative ATP-dependent zinc protease n=1 Tax=Vibrio sp. SCSIO 43137 TaxID=3021011 RepID=UPI002307A905|nr:RimK/LysX family protein [Vibrio sp. SCSIO 43137]WCE32617.1 RimK/LysX family protein [Vibrio sp. SCSIO 43137]